MEHIRFQIEWHDIRNLILHFFFSRVFFCCCLMLGGREMSSRMQNNRLHASRFTPQKFQLTQSCSVNLLRNFLDNPFVNAG